MAFESAIAQKIPEKRVNAVFMATTASEHAVGLEVHGRVRLNMVAFIDRACEIDRIILITVDAEDLLGARLDLANVVHQLPAVRMAREPIDGDDLEVDGDRPLAPHGHLAPAFLDAPAVCSFCLVPDKDQRILLVLRQVQEVFHDRR